MRIEELLFERPYDLHWQMPNIERLIMVQILRKLNPALAIEIGTYKCGSLQVIAEFSKHVISVDANPMLNEEFGSRFPNVDFVPGLSQETLPWIIEKLNSEGQSPDFVLVDGDHSTEGVRNDVNLLLSIKPQRPMVMLMHDSFNPACREGMLSANWENCPFVQSVDIDFMIGGYTSGGVDTAEPGSMWGGLGCAILTPERRQNELEIRQGQKEAVAAVKRISVHNKPVVIPKLPAVPLTARVRSVLRPVKRFLERRGMLRGNKLG